MSVTGKRNVRWENYGGQVNYTPELTFTPQSLDDLVEIIRTAERDQKQIRATKSFQQSASVLDTGCSFTDVAVADDYLLQMDRFTQSLEYIGQSDHIPHFGGHWSVFQGMPRVPFKADALNNRYGLLYVEAGVRIKHLADWLRNYGAALPTMGGVQVQTLAGAISTGTHGSDLNMPPLADMVRAIHLVGPGGKQFWIERSQPHQVTNADGFRSPTWSSGLEVIYDDNTFFSALISLGRLGVVYGLVIEVDKWFWLYESTIIDTWSSISNDLRNKSFAQFVEDSSLASDDWSTHHPLPMHHMTLALSLGGDGRCYQIRRWKTNDTTRRPKRVYSPSNFQVWHELHGAGRGHLAAVLGELIGGNVATFDSLSASDKRFLNNWYFSKQFTEETAQDTYWEIMKGDPPPMRGSSAEYCFDVDNKAYVTFVDQVLGLVNNPQLAGWLSLRFTQQSQALLAMQRFKQTVHIEISVIQSRSNSSAFRRIDAAARRLGGIPHWGQLHRLTRAEVSQIYGDDLEKFRKAIKRLARYGEKSTFSNSFTRDRGIEPINVRDNLLLFGA